ncbi:MAG: Ribonuclease P protein component [Candidatus Daviesbacteria bacterium GW2011_GWA1_41_61]|uniref:Ribonuclease P protein component n=1 Tax=Candidatus Daviesbacteria bacterium GW2011_GWA2_40_9 TaxID=1618424 RepID=A0A0G0WES3_9BACT|nr:MAG: Ribonuclease P protein component [Candidatus Daviesbacteria bacterium GW2011_GWC1_40_9]KKR82760.1 MAG: Ribonuclease P protein component [Candidatus Daviesbacteria bacterium GW2011_GWA2_40_9]KKR93774.1 MAG: Ribonuclease P protein component [Candidatus Daviesbacteria bacterium GW2011_GWB1_41_15]KKS15240.1 MAG: Ribonuclease P protein component [Candidatus Daviesbacteria bacterium GW2011_GWA1_41_61]
MLSKDKRLNLKRDFQWVASGEKISSEIVKLFYRYGENNQAQVGIAVSSSVFKKAVQRNRARRLVSTAFEALYPNLSQQVKIIAIPRQGVLKLNPAKILNYLKSLLKKRNLLKK